MTTVSQLIGTGKYDEKKMLKFWNKQLKVNGGNVNIADAMLRIYNHTFEIKIKQIQP